MKKQLLFINFLVLSTFIHAQISIVQDINPGSGDGIIEYNGLNNRVGNNGNLYFTATDGTNGFEVWKTDGTSSGTNLLHDIMPPNGNNAAGLGSSFPWEYFVSDDYIFFSAARFNSGNIQKSEGNEMYRLDLNDDSLLALPLINTLFFGGTTPNDAAPRNYVRLGNELFFTASVTGGTTSQFFRDELCSFTGDTFGTFPNSGGQFGLEVMIEDINPANNVGSDPRFLTAYNGKIYFTADDGTNGRELWVSDGTTAGTFMLHDINSGSGSSNPTNLLVHNNRLFFIAENPTFGREIWSTDGSASGLILLETAVFGNLGNVTELVASSQAIYFAYDDPSLGHEIGYTTNGTNGVFFPNDINSGTGDSNPSNLFPLASGGLIWTADNGTNGVELYYKPSPFGTPNNWVQLKNINTQQETISQEGSSNAQGFIQYGNNIYFSADDGINGRQLWTTDLTTNGTGLVGLINTTGGEGSPANSANPRDFVVSGNTLYFSAETSSQGLELWKFNDPTLSTSVDQLLQVRLYPNPSNSFIKIDGFNETSLNVTIYDITGKEVYSNIDYVVNSKIDIENFNSGLYIVKLETEAASKIMKLVKN